MTPEEDTKRSCVYAFHEKYCEKPKFFTEKYFSAVAVPRSTLFKIKSVKKTESHQKSSVRPPKIITKRGIYWLVKLFDHKCGPSH